MIIKAERMSVLPFCDTFRREETEHGNPGIQRQRIKPFGERAFG